MGCGAGKAVASRGQVQNQGSGRPDSQHLAVVVWGARGLRRGDVVGSDPYCVVRFGPASSTWAEKQGTGRRSPAAAGGDVADPTWNFGCAVNVEGTEKPEVHIRLYDADLFTDDDFLGEARAPLEDLKAGDGADQPPQRVELPISGTGKEPGGTLLISVGGISILGDEAVQQSATFDALGPMGALRSWDVTDKESAIPLRVGAAPLPSALRGIWWLTDQKNSSALASFGGPSRDGGGCSTGHFNGNRYIVRVPGDRVWAMASKTSAEGLVSVIDLIYHFVFDSAESPTRCQIHPEGARIGAFLDQEWLLDFEMVFAPEGDEKYPGSMIWRRPSYILGKMVYEYALVQVADEHGTRIEPAWTEFVKYQTSARSGGSPGVIWYRDVDELDRQLQQDAELKQEHELKEKQRQQPGKLSGKELLELRGQLDALKAKETAS